MEFMAFTKWSTKYIWYYDLKVTCYITLSGTLSTKI